MRVSGQLNHSVLVAMKIATGAYVVVHNRVYPVHRVRKVHSLGRFTWTDGLT